MSDIGSDPLIPKNGGTGFSNANASKINLSSPVIGYVLTSDAVGTCTLQAPASSSITISGNYGSPLTGNTFTINGAVVASGTNPVRTHGLSGTMMAIEVQTSQAIAAADATKIGLSNFDSAAFDVDANGFVQLNGGGIAATAFDVQANTAPGTDPVLPTSAGVVTVNGAVVANHSVVLETRSRAANAYNVEVQYATSAAATDATKSGVSHFNSTQFSVDANGFVALAGGGLAVDSLSPDSGTDPVVPTAAGIINDKGSGSITTVGSLNTITTQLTGLTNHAVLVGAGTTTITKLAVGSNGQVLVGSTGADPSFATLTSSDSSISFTTGANTLSLQVASGTGVVKTLTGNSGGAISPTTGNIGTVGTGSITVDGSGSTLTTQLTGLTNHNVLIGAGTATITNVAPSATSGVPLISQGASSDPVFGTAVVAGGGTGATSFTANGAVISNTTTTGALAAVALGNQQFLVGNTSAAPTAKTLKVVAQVFTSSGTYTPTSGMVYCISEVVGGGGGGAGTGSSAGNSPGGGGGGGGGYSRKVNTAAAIGASQTVTVGTGGAGGTGAANGTGGVTSSFGAIHTATGGAGGGQASAAGTGTFANGSVGGVGTGGDFNSNGGCSGPGTGIGVPATGSFSMGGGGGNSIFGGGAACTGANSTTGPVNGNAGSAYGGGGGGAAGKYTDATTANGGAGFAGIVIVTEFVLAT